MVLVAVLSAFWIDETVKLWPMGMNNHFCTIEDGPMSENNKHLVPKAGPEGFNPILSSNSGNISFSVLCNPAFGTLRCRSNVYVRISAYHPGSKGYRNIPCCIIAHCSVSHLISSYRIVSHRSTSCFEEGYSSKAYCVIAGFAQITSTAVD